MLVEKPIAFESLDFLPGFPTLSKFACNPFSNNLRTGACAQPPTAVGRERTALVGWPAVQAAIIAAGGQMPNYSGAMMAGLGAEHGESYHRRPMVRTMLSGSGGGIPHGRRWGDPAYEGAHPPASTSRNDHPHYHARLGGCGCGGTCGGCSGSGLGFTLDPTSIMSWVTANWMPLAVGAGIVYFLKRR